MPLQHCSRQWSPVMKKLHLSMCTPCKQRRHTHTVWCMQQLPECTQHKTSMQQLCCWTWLVHRHAQSCGHHVENEYARVLHCQKRTGAVNSSNLHHVDNSVALPEKDRCSEQQQGSPLLPVTELLALAIPAMTSLMCCSAFGVVSLVTSFPV